MGSISGVTWKCFEQDSATEEVPLRVCTLSQVKTKQRASHVLPEAYTNVESFGGSGFTLSTRAQFAFYSMIYTRVGFNIEIPTDLLSAV